VHAVRHITSEEGCGSHAPELRCAQAQQEFNIARTGAARAWWQGTQSVRRFSIWHSPPPL
jgi:hypothetical protein